jgi:hypothetical protein
MKIAKKLLKEVLEEAQAIGRMAQETFDRNYEACLLIEKATNNLKELAYNHDVKINNKTIIDEAYNLQGE